MTKMQKFTVPGTGSPEADTDLLETLATVSNSKPNDFVHIKLRGQLTLKRPIFFRGNIRLSGPATIAVDFDAKIDPRTGAPRVARFGSTDAAITFAGAPGEELNFKLPALTGEESSIKLPPGASKVKDGDWLSFVSSTADAESAASTSRYGCSALVRRVEGPQVIFDGGLPDAVPAEGKSITVIRNQPISNIVVENLNFVNANKRIVQLLYFFNTDNVLVSNVVAEEDAPGGFICNNFFRHHWEGLIHGGVTDEMVNVWLGAIIPQFTYNNQYGVLVSGRGNGFHLDAANMARCRHCFTTGSGPHGRTHNLLITNSSFSGSASAVLDTHGSGELKVSNCRVQAGPSEENEPREDNNAGCIQIRSANCILQDNTLVGASGMKLLADGAMAIGNVIRSPNGTCIGLSGNNCRVLRNDLSAKQNGVHLMASKGSLVANNTFRDAGQVGLSAFIATGTKNYRSQSATITGNILSKGKHNQFSIQDDAKLPPAEPHEIHNNICLGYGSEWISDSSSTKAPTPQSSYFNETGSVW